MSSDLVLKSTAWRVSCFFITFMIKSWFIYTDLMNPLWEKCVLYCVTNLWSQEHTFVCCWEAIYSYSVSVSTWGHSWFFGQSAWLKCYWLQLRKLCYLFLIEPDSCFSHWRTRPHFVLTLLNPLIPTSPFMISRPNQFVTCFWKRVVSAADSD